MVPPSLSDFDGFAKHLTDDTLTFDSPAISFRLAGHPDSHFLEGPGTIRVSRSGGITAKLFPQQSQFHSTSDVVGDFSQAGRIISDDEYYRGSAFDKSGRAWQLEGTHGDFEFARGNQAAPFCCEIRCHELRIADKYYPYPILGTSLQMAFCFDLPFPPNAGTERQTKEGSEVVEDSAWMDRVQVDLDGIKIVIRSRRSPLGNRYVVLSADSESELPEHLEWALTEALQLSMGIDCPWTATKWRKDDQIQIRIRRTHLPSRSLLPPPTSMNPGRSGNLWDFFIRYLAFVRHKAESKWHDLAIWQYDAMTAPTFDALSLAVAIAVEGASRIVSSRLGILESNPALAIHKSELLQLVGNWAGGNPDAEKVRTANRVVGFLNNLQNEGPYGVLMQIANRGIVTNDQVAAWKALRNPSAHAMVRAGQPTQDDCDHQGAVISMFYRLVAFIIGYEGKLIDYGSVGWKSVDAPKSALFRSAQLPEIGIPAKP